MASKAARWCACAIRRGGRRRCVPDQRPVLAWSGAPGAHSLHTQCPMDCSLYGCHIMIEAHPPTRSAYTALLALSITAACACAAATPSHHR